jgi:replication factor C subunit 3/5
LLEPQICKVLAYAAKKERLSLPDHVSTILARISQGNLRRALLSLEALHTQDPSFKTVSASHSLLTGTKQSASDLDSVPRPDWEKYAGRAAEKILGDQTPERLLEVRGMLYELLVHCIPAPLIISVSLCLFLLRRAEAELTFPFSTSTQTIAKRLMDRVDEELKADVVYWAAFYEHRLRLGSKPIFHLEGELPLYSLSSHTQG